MDLSQSDEKNKFTFRIEIQEGDERIAVITNQNMDEIIARVYNFLRVHRRII